MMRVLRVLFSLVLVGMLLGSTQCQNTTNDGTNSDGPIFVTTLAAEDANGNAASSFSQSAEIQFVLSVRNRTSSSQTISFSTGQQYNFEVLDSGTATEVWTWSLGQAFSQATTSLTFAAGETQTFAVTWDQLNDSGQLIPTGSYEVIGGMTCTNNSSSNSSSSSSSSTSSTCMPTGSASSGQLVPSVYISTLVPFTIR
jgi:Intracellular proteinase inhibitor